MTQLEVYCVACQGTLVRIHKFEMQMNVWSHLTASLLLPLPPGCVSCLYQFLQVRFTPESPIVTYPRDWEGFRINEVPYNPPPPREPP